jgi:Family of unknown function (DUF5681)
MDETVAVKENGRSRRITKLEAAAKQLANRAASGDQRAMQLVARFIEAAPRHLSPSPNASPRATLSSCASSSAVSRGPPMTATR